MPQDYQPVSLQPEILSQLENDISENGYAMLDDFLTGTEISAILQRFEELEREDAFKQAGVGKLNRFTIAPEIRGDVIRWIDPDDDHMAIKGLLDKTKALMQYFHEHFHLPVRDLEMHYTEYPPGRFYRRHSDCFREQKHRLISFVYYFNEHWKPEDGGELRIYHPSGCADIPPVSKRLVIFRSDLEHEVLMTHQKRYSITGWMLDRPQDLTFL